MAVVLGLTFQIGCYLLTCKAYSTIYPIKVVNTGPQTMLQTVAKFKFPASQLNDATLRYTQILHVKSTFNLDHHREVRGNWGEIWESGEADLNATYFNNFMKKRQNRFLYIRNIAM